MTLSFFAGQLYFGHKLVNSYGTMGDAFAKTRKMAKQKFRPTRLGGFSGAKAYIRYVEVLKKRRNAARADFLRRHQKKLRGRSCGAFRRLWKTCFPLLRNLYDIGGLGTLLALSDVEAHPLPFGQGLESLTLNHGKVHEYIRTTFLLDETKPFGIVKPFHHTFCHFLHSFGSRLLPGYRCTAATLENTRGFGITCFCSPDQRKSTYYRH
jgi:hypothetical protein